MDFVGLERLALVVPFTHQIKPGYKGKDVEGVKRALWRANGLRFGTGFTPTYGPIAVKEAKIFQERKHLAPDGVIGPATIHALAPYFDQYAFFLYEGYKPNQSPEQAKRARMLAYAVWGYNNRALIYYAMFRPMELLEDLWHLPVSEDCSTFYTKGAKAAGWRDPNGLDYDGAGNTQTLAAHGRQVSLATAKIGDAILYSDPQHVGIYVGDERIISHGSNPGPSLTDVNYRPDFWQARSYF